MRWRGKAFRNQRSPATTGGADLGNVLKPCPRPGTVHGATSLRVQPSPWAPQRGTAWRWAYIAFRLGDGATQALLPLAIVLHYGLPIWVLALTTACMNLVSVPATFLWGAVMDRSHRRRAIVVTGFSVAAGSMAIASLLPPIAAYVAAAMLYSMFGVATSPAASTLAIRDVPREAWGQATSRLSRSTGLAFLGGMLITLVLGLSLGAPPFSALFAAGAGVAAVAASIAAFTVPDQRNLGPRTFDPAVTMAGQRQFERPVFFPLRIGNRPTVGGVRAGLQDRHRLWPLGILLTFTGSVAFFTSYPGVLSTDLLLPAGLVLLCQAPSHIVSPLVYPAAARHGSRVGESRAVQQGALLRLFGVPGLCAAILFLGNQTPVLVGTLVVFHALMGLSFSLMQVNGPLLLAGLHPGGPGQGVGLYHAALGTGTLLGSLSAFILLRFADAWVSYQFAMALTLAGVACLLVAHRRLDRDASATAKSGSPLPRA